MRIFHLSKLWKANFFVLCDVIFLVRLHCWKVGRTYFFNLGVKGSTGWPMIDTTSAPSKAMQSHVLHIVWCNISGEATGEIWYWSLRRPMIDTMSAPCGRFWSRGSRRRASQRSSPSPRGKLCSGAISPRTSSRWLARSVSRSRTRRLKSWASRHSCREPSTRWAPGLSGPGKTRTLCGGYIADVAMFPIRWLVLRATFVADTKNFVSWTQKSFWKSSETFLVSAWRATMLLRFATDGKHCVLVLPGPKGLGGVRFGLWRLWSRSSDLLIASMIADIRRTTRSSITNSS